MDFYKRDKRPETIPYPKSDKIVPTYSLKIDKQTGKKELVKTGSTNLYEKIQAAKEETMIYNILERFNAGEIDVINKVKGVYGDFRNVPTSLAEAQQAIIDAEDTFNKLPLDIRREFNMSTSEFLASLNNGEFERIIKEKYGDKLPKQEEVQQNTTINQEIQQHFQQGGNVNE